MDCYCSVCCNDFTAEEPDILTFSKHGGCRRICPDCKALYLTATTATDPEEAENALASLRKILMENRDLTVLDLFSEVMPDAEARVKAIRDGTYDFSLDENTEEAEEEAIPEELQITEEDKAAFETELGISEEASMFDKILNILWIVIAAGAVGVVGYFIARAIFKF